MLASVATWVVIALVALIANPPLGHDESQYAVAARDASSPWRYLSPGTIAIAHAGLGLGDSDWMVRLLPALLGLGFLVAGWWVGRVACGGGVGAWTAAVMAGAHPLVLRNSELLSDMPAAACLLAGIALLVRELERDRTSWWLVAAAPAFAAAFYLRYGSAVVIALAAVAALALWWPRVRARPWPVIATVLVFTVLMIPHAVYALRTTGHPLGILLLSSKVPYHAYPGEGLVGYLTANPVVFYGALAGPLMIAGVIGMARGPHRRARWFIAIVALGQIVSLGLQTRAQPRYVCFATTLLVILGVDALLRTRAVRYHVVGKTLVVLSWIGVLIAIAPLCDYLERARTPLVTAAKTIEHDAAGRPCAIAALAAPQLMWRTHCAVVLPSQPWPEHHLRYIVSLPHYEIDVPSSQTATAVVPPQETRVWQLK